MTILTLTTLTAKKCLFLIFWLTVLTATKNHYPDSGHWFEMPFEHGYFFSPFGESIIRVISAIRVQKKQIRSIRVIRVRSFLQHKIIF